MKWETHQKIADRVASDLSLEKSHRNLLLKYSVIPDEWRDFPHHVGKSGDIRGRIMDSRKSWLSGNLEEAIKQLGIAFHYICDSLVPPHNHPEHDEIEKKLNKAVIKSTPNSFPFGKKETLEFAVKNLGFTDSDPQKIINKAYEICWGISRSVFSSPVPSVELAKKLLESCEKFSKKLFGIKFAIFTAIFSSLILFLHTQEPFRYLYLILLISNLPWLGVLREGSIDRVLNASKLYESSGGYIFFDSIFLIVLAFFGVEFAVLGLIPFTAGIYIIFVIGKNISPEIIENHDWFNWRLSEKIVKEANNIKKAKNCKNFL